MSAADLDAVLVAQSFVGDQCFFVEHDKLRLMGAVHERL
jgi:hypothetical protein